MAMELKQSDRTIGEKREEETLANAFALHRHF